MAVRLDNLVAAPPSGRQRALLLDSDDYATAVVRQGSPIPWGELAAFTGFVGQVNALLSPDATWIDGGAFYADRLAANPDLGQAMGARSRTGYALRTLLGDPDGIEQLVRAGETVGSATRRPLVLACPSPGRWLALAQHLAAKPVAEVDPDAADTASMYIAQWLGKLGALPVALVVFDARGGAGGAAIAPESLAAYTSITNVADHLGWTVALWTTDGVETRGETVFGVVPSEYWTDGGALPDGDVLLATIPRDATPERVLEQLGRID
ncbi:hypothetical protein [Amycolatopsis benzoatilytica]|uniref:hypothetical protein n=1 Tax=Amycolatopsis benzoatilytica TaxID=346045 RepID=UPI0003763971|nr:hypothetical protein [Amycolatopsis benzoatilytica]